MNFPLSRLALNLTAFSTPESQGSRSQLENGTYSIACDSLEDRHNQGRVRLKGWIHLEGGSGVDTFLNTISEAQATARLDVCLQEGGFDSYQASHQIFTGRYVVGQSQHELVLENESLELRIVFGGREQAEVLVKRKLRVRSA